MSSRDAARMTRRGDGAAALHGHADLPAAGTGRLRPQQQLSVAPGATAQRVGEQRCARGGLCRRACAANLKLRQKATFKNPTCRAPLKLPACTRARSDPANRCTGGTGIQARTPVPCRVTVVALGSHRSSVAHAAHLHSSPNAAAASPRRQRAARALLSAGTCRIACPAATSKCACGH